jgi:hypothetical protein
MKILMTGATRLQRLAPEDRPPRPSDIQKIDVPAAVRDSLIRLGHNVVWRPTVVGENLHGFDLIWCSISSPLSPNATAGVAGGMYWTHAHHEIPIVTFYDDWKSTRLGHSNTKSLLKQPIHFLTRVLVGPKELRGDRVDATWSGYDAYDRASIAVEERKAELSAITTLSETRINQLRAEYFYQDRDAIIDNYAAMITGAEAIQYGRPNQVRAVPMYAWGDPESVYPHLGEFLTKRKPTIMALDPSHVTEEIVSKARPHFFPHEIRKQEWALALLSKPSDLLRTIPTEDQPKDWPINMIGHRETGIRLETEVDVLVWTSGHGGLLSLPYYGSRKAGPLKGWWRSRYIYGAAARVPVATAQREADALGIAYNYSPRAIERMAGEMRRDLADEQANELRKRYTNRAGFDQQVAETIRAATS